MIRMWMGIVLLTVAAAFSGCNILGGDDDGDGHVSLDNAEYFGTLEDGDGDLFRMKVIFDDDGNIADVELDGVSRALTGEVTHEQGDIFSFELSDGRVGGFIAKGKYTAFLTDDWDFGSLQKNAEDLASSYSQSDVTGTWKGYTVELDADFVIEDTYDSEVTVASSGSFEGSDDTGATFTSTSPLTIDSTVYGRYLGTSTDDTGTFTPDIRVFLTPDKQFAASWACENSGFPDNCTFNSWEKD